MTFGTVATPLPSGATVTISGSDVLYTPPVGYSGPASFTYTVTDNGTTNGAADPLTSTGTASLFFLFPGVALPVVDLNGRRLTLATRSLTPRTIRRSSSPRLPRR